MPPRPARPWPSTSRNEQRPMSDTLTANASGVAADVPEYPMDRDARCPFAPPPQMLEMGEAKPLSRVRIWNGSTPWLITGHAVARELFADSRVSVDDRRDGFPHWNEHMLSTVQQAAAVGVHLRRRGAHPVPPDAVQAVHLQARRGPALRPSRRSPTSASTRSWPARSPPTSSRSSHCRCRPG